MCREPHEHSDTVTQSRQPGPEIARGTSAPHTLRHVSQQSGPVRFREEWGAPGQSLPPAGACERRCYLTLRRPEERLRWACGDSLSCADFQTAGLFRCTTPGGTARGLPARLGSQAGERGGGPSFGFRAPSPSPAPTRPGREGLRAGGRQWGRAGGKRLFMLC